jgi:hypothetical protein
MHRKSLLKSAAAFGFTALLTVAAVSGAQAQDAKADNHVRVRGAITKMDGSTLMVKTREGTDATIMLKSGWKVSTVKNAAIDGIKPGDYVGIASLPTADGGDGALEVLIFPAAMKGTGEGNRPWDLKPNSSMTNATVADAVKSVDGHMITVTFQGKEKKIKVPEGTPVVTIAPATEADLKAGAPVIVNGERGSDGMISAASVIVGTNGVVPPM